MKNYKKFLSWAVIYFIPRETQDDKKDKLEVSAIFRTPVNANDYINTLQNKDRFFVVDVDDLERIEEFYNFISDLKEKYNSYWIYRLDEKYFSVDEHNKFRTILNLWTN